MKTIVLRKDDMRIRFRIGTCKADYSYYFNGNDTKYGDLLLRFTSPLDCVSDDLLYYETEKGYKREINK